MRIGYVKETTKKERTTLAKVPRTALKPMNFSKLVNRYSAVFPIDLAYKLKLKTLLEPLIKRPYVRPVSVPNYPLIHRYSAALCPNSARPASAWCV